MYTSDLGAAPIGSIWRWRSPVQGCWPRRGCSDSACSASGAVVCSGPPSASDGAGNVCTSGTNALAAAGNEQSNSVTVNTSVTGSAPSVLVSLSEANDVTAGGFSANNNSATAEGTGAAALAGNDETNIETVTATVTGNSDVVTLSESGSNVLDGDFTADNDTAIAEGAGATAVSGSNQTNIETEDTTITGNTDAVAISENGSNVMNGDFTADNDTATAKGTGATAVAGSNQTTIDTASFTTSADNQTLSATVTDTLSDTGNVTANNDTATADGTEATAFAGSDNGSSSGDVTADDDTAIADGTEAPQSPEATTAPPPAMSLPTTTRRSPTEPGLPPSPGATTAVPVTSLRATTRPRPMPATVESPPARQMGTALRPLRSPTARRPSRRPPQRRYRPALGRVRSPWHTTAVVSSQSAWTDSPSPSNSSLTQSRRSASRLSRDPTAGDTGWPGEPDFGR